MLEIIVDRRFTLNLPPDIQINFIEENPLFATDRIPAPYSLSFEVPPTANNLKAFNFAIRITSVNGIRKAPAEIRHSGMVMAKGEILLIEAENLLSLQFKGSREADEVNQNLNQLDYGTWSYGSFQYHAEDLDYQSAPLEEYVRSMRAQAYLGIDYVIAPVKIKDTTWTGLETRGGMTNSVRQYINYFNPLRKDFFIKDIRKAHTPILPFPYVHRIIDLAFGKTLESNPFASGDLASLVLISTNHHYYRFDNLYSWFWVPPLEETIVEVMFPLVDSYESSGGLIPIRWNIMNFCQEYAFRELLKNLMKIFCMTAYPGVKYRIEFNNDIMARTNRVNWDGKLAGDPVISWEEGKDYVFRYDKVRKSGEEIVRSHPNIQAIFETAIATAAESGTEYQDASNGAQYKITRTLRGLTSQPWLSCEVKSSPLASNEPAGNRDKTEVVSEICPAEMSIEQFWWEDYGEPKDLVQKKHWFVPVIEKKDRSDPPCIMFFSGIARPFDVEGEYPYLMAHHTDHFGIKRQRTSLHPEGPGGLLEQFHGSMKAWTEKDKMRVKGSFRLTLLEVKKLDIRDKVFFHGRLFYIEKLTYSLSNEGISLIEADLIMC